MTDDDKPYLVSEQGPELFIPNARGARVYNKTPKPTPEQRELAEVLFVQSYTVDEVAERVGISTGRARQIRNRLTRAIGVLSAYNAKLDEMLAHLRALNARRGE